ncbi:MAG: hypothetical protein GY835_01880 [bacterium]|nr:hypothetical protein [bacterium]
MEFFKSCGMMGAPLLILTVVILILVFRAAVALRCGRREHAVFPILFWGFVAAVLGFLGQIAGLYNALTAIAHASQLDSNIVRQGLTESFSTTLWGGALLLLSGLAYSLFALVGRAKVKMPAIV